MLKIKEFLNSRYFIYILLAIASFVLAAKLDNYDYDLYARLIVGENFIENGTFLYNDFLSYTPTHIWYDHEWGSSLVFYSLYKYLGVAGFVWFQAVMLFLTAFWVMKVQSIQKKAYPVSIAFVLIFLLLLSHLNPSLIRCHMFSFMFYAMFLYFLEKTRLQNSNILWLAPPIVVIWNNLHGGVVSGLGMIFVYMLAAIITRKPWRKYFWVLVLSSAALIINPYGMEYLTFLVSANTKARTFITEWWGVFTGRHVLYYFPPFVVAALAIILPISEFIKTKKITIVKFLALLLVTYLGFKHVKLLSISLITVAAFYYNDFIRFFDKSKIRFLNKLASGLIICSICYLPFVNINQARVKFDKFPVMEVEFLIKNEIKGNLLTAFGLGSYCTYKLYPQNLLYMDGRYEEVYYDREFENLMNFELVNPTWELVFTHYPTDILMKEKGSKVYETLKTSKQWKLIYEGAVCGVFVKSENVKSNYIKPSEDLNYYIETAFDNMGEFSNKK